MLISLGGVARLLILPANLCFVSAGQLHHQLLQLHDTKLWDKT